ncbi:zinc finger protein 425-like [Drosophila tropicalis]|uniref:zinc finger protein 425-like n=1 Tax=Drosophila tropicalis TaxID=46794 RepID=UPI0035AC1F0D
MFHLRIDDDFTFGVKQEPELDLNADEPLTEHFDVQEEEASESVVSLANSHGVSSNLLGDIKEEADLNCYDRQTENGRESGLSNFEEFQITFLPEEEDGVFKCTQCPTEYLKRTIFLNHLKTHQYANVKCPYCPRTFVFAVYMEKHIRHFHKEHVDCLNDGEWKKMFAKHTGSWHRSHEGKQVEKEIFKCFECGRAFVRKLAFMKHLQAHKYKCTECPMEFKNSEDYTSHKKTHLGVIRFKCRHCSKGFLRKDRYLTHLRSHAEEIPAKCPYQPKMLDSSKSRKSREFETAQHTDNKDDESYGQDPLSTVLSESKPANPLRRIRTKSKKKLLCPHCPMSYKYKLSLDKHIETHQPNSDKNVCEKSSHSCPHCPLTYKYKLSLEKHIETHQSNSDKNVCVRSKKSSYSCPYCPLTYKYKPSLEKHIGTHRHSAEDLDSHKPTNIDDKRFWCPKCPRIFSKKNRYLSHLRWHGGEQNIKCPHCPKMFLSTKSLALHTRFHNV